MNVKKWLSGLAGAISVWLLGALSPITDLYSPLILEGPNDHNNDRLLTIMLFVEWPILLILGAIVGVCIYKRLAT